MFTVSFGGVVGLVVLFGLVGIGLALVSNAMSSFKKGSPKNRYYRKDTFWPYDGAWRTDEEQEQYLAKAQANRFKMAKRS